jgi:hypothetical protein
VCVQFEARVEARLQRFKDPHGPRRAPVRFTHAIPKGFKGAFPVLYVVGEEVTDNSALLGAHSVVLPGAATAQA